MSGLNPNTVFTNPTNSQFIANQTSSIVGRVCSPRDAWLVKTLGGGKKRKSRRRKTQKKKTQKRKTNKVGRRRKKVMKGGSWAYSHFNHMRSSSYGYDSAGAEYSKLFKGTLPAYSESARNNMCGGKKRKTKRRRNKTARRQDKKKSFFHPKWRRKSGKKVKIYKSRKKL